MLDVCATGKWRASRNDPDCGDDGGVAAWNPRFGSPHAFAPLTGLVTYNWDAAAPYETGNYSQPPPAPTGVDHWVSKIPGAGTDAVTVTLDWDAPTGAGAADVVGYRVGITRPGQIFGQPHDPYYRHSVGTDGNTLTQVTYYENFGRHSDLRARLGADAGGYVDGTDRDLRPNRTGGMPTNQRIGDTLQYWISALTADGNESIPVLLHVDLTRPAAVWSADLTVGEISLISDGFSASPSVGALSNTTFSFKGTGYTIDQVSVGAGVALAFSFSGHGLGDEASNLVLEVGQEQYDFGEARYASDTHSYSWTSPVLSWSVAEVVALRILYKPRATTVQASERPTPPTGVTATTYDGGFWRVEWDRTDDHTVTGYEIGYRGSPDMPWQSYLADVGPVTDFDYHDLLPSFPGDPSRKPLRPCGGEQCVHTDYRNFRVRALNSAGASVWHYQTHTVRASDKDITTLASAGNANMQGMHVHDGTLYVPDAFDEHLYAYDLNTGQRDETKEIDLGFAPWRGVVRRRDHLGFKRNCGQQINPRVRPGHPSTRRRQGHHYIPQRGWPMVRRADYVGRSPPPWRHRRLQARPLRFRGPRLRQGLTNWESHKPKNLRSVVQRRRAAGPLRR